MYDLNFFEGHVETTEVKLNSKFVYILTFSLLAIFLIGYITYNSLLIKAEMKTIANLKQVAENPETVRQVEAIKVKEIQVNELETAVEQIKLLDTTVLERKEVDEKLLKTINKNMPNDLFLTSLSIQEGEIYIAGISQDKNSIAEFQKALESLEGYEEIFVSHISLEEGYYNFALDIAAKEIETELEEEEGVIADEGTDQE